MLCPNCSAEVPMNARFCPQCGFMLVVHEPSPEKSGFFSGEWTPFFMSLALSLALSYILIMVFHLPIFLLGGVLPFFWLGRRRK